MLQASRKNRIYHTDAVDDRCFITARFWFVSSDQTASIWTGGVQGGRRMISASVCSHLAGCKTGDDEFCVRCPLQNARVQVLCNFCFENYVYKYLYTKQLRRNNFEQKLNPAFCKVNLTKRCDRHVLHSLILMISASVCSRLAGCFCI